MNNEKRPVKGPNGGYLYKSLYRCPKCRKQNISIIEEYRVGVSGYFCRDCGHRWKPKRKNIQVTHYENEQIFYEN